MEQKILSFSDICPETPSHTQKQMIVSNERELGFGGRAGGGKSSALLMSAARFVNTPGYDALLIRKTYSDLSQPGGLMDRAHQWWNNIAHWDGEKKTFIFPSGARVTFRHMSDQNAHMNMQGGEYAFTGIDELSHFQEIQYTFMFSRQRASKLKNVPLRMQSTFNPGGIGHNWIQNRWQIPEEGHQTIWSTEIPGNNRRIFIPSKLSDNPAGTKYIHDYEQSLLQLDAVTYAQMAEGRWTQGSNLKIYPSLNVIKHSANPDISSISDRRKIGWNACLGIDFGVVDKCAWVIIESDPWSLTSYFTFCHSISGLSPTEASSTTQDLIEQFNPEFIVGDAGGLGKGFIQEIEKHWNIPVHPAEKRDKRGYMRLLDGKIAQNHIMFSSDCLPLAKEMNNLLFKNEMRLEEHPACENHMSDAALYAWRHLEHYSQQETKKKIKTDWKPDEFELKEMELAEQEQLWNKWK